MPRFCVFFFVLFCSLVISIQAGSIQASSDTKSADPIRLGYVVSDGQVQGTLKAYKGILQQYPQLRGRVKLTLMSESLMEQINADQIMAVDLLVLSMHEQHTLDKFNQRHQADLIASVINNDKVWIVGSGLSPKEYFLQQGAELNEAAFAFYEYSGPENQRGLLALALQELGVPDIVVPDPQPGLKQGYYYPYGEQGKVFADWTDFDQWRQQEGIPLAPGKRIAVGFFSSAYKAQDLDVIDAVIREIESRGGEAIPIFGYPAHQAFAKLLLDDQQQARADVALSFLFRFADFSASKSLKKIDIPVINMATLYGRSEQDWRESRTGFSIFEGTFQVSVPELAGLIAPTVAGSKEKRFDLETNTAIVVSTPINERIRAGVQRALKYAALRQKLNRDKKLALLYYNHPPGKANIGASYLNVADSLANVLQALEQAGYMLGDKDLSSAAIEEEITEKARNIISKAPGELKEMLAEGRVIRIPAEQYQQWLAQLAPALKDKILADWGAVENSRLMVDANSELGSDKSVSLLIPVLRYGNVILLPQPARGWGEDLEQLYHADDLAPHHQYTAVYSWLQKVYGADAVVHVGTHGTLEWLDGKDTGLSSEDASDALIADLPNLYIYNVDVVGEGLVARRRGMAALVDHMVPPFVKGGLYGELAKLGELIDSYHNNAHKNPDLAGHYAEDISKLVVELGIAKDLGLSEQDLSSTKNDTLKHEHHHDDGRPQVHSADTHTHDEPAANQGLDHELIHKLQGHMLKLKEKNIPYGLHAFGRRPESKHIDSTVDAIVSADRSLLPKAQKVLTEDMHQRVRDSAVRELENLLVGLDGRYLMGGNGGDPIRNPDAYPTGKNFYSIDPNKVPKKASWKLGVKLAEEMLAKHKAEHGEMMRKASFVIWGTETLRHEGVMESQILHLLGVKPVWNERGKVVDIAVVPRAQLGRPRVDIVIASAAEGMFSNITLLIDKAVQRVKLLDEADNSVREHYLATKETLMQAGYSEAEAERRAGVRIFDEPPGVYNLNTATIAAASGSWDSDIAMAHDYLKRMGHGYGNGFWGEPMEDVFRLALSGTDTIVHSSSTALYGALDNDDFFMYMGGLAAAIRSLDGETPAMVVTDTSDPGSPAMTSIDEFIGVEFRSRYLNPTWIKGMQKEGYAGAGHMRKFVEYLWGWDATVPETIDDAMWQASFEVYVQDKNQLGLKAFFDESSPFAFQDINARMLETIRKQYWQASDTTLQTLLEEYINSVKQHGVSCTEFTCGNPRLLEYVIDQAEKHNIPAEDIKIFQQTMESVIEGDIRQLAESARQFVKDNEARIRNRQIPGVGQEQMDNNVQQGELQGYRMEKIADKSQAQKDKAEPSKEDSSDAVQKNSEFSSYWFAVLLITALIIWWYRARRRVNHG